MSDLPVKTAKVAVSKATYWIDKPYEYAVPEELSSKVCPGTRVRLQFSRGKSLCDAIVLSTSAEASSEELKSIAEVMDEEPVLTPELIKLALYMREHFFCTVYEAARAMLPVGLWFDSSGKRNIKDAYLETAVLDIPEDEAEELSRIKAKRAPLQSAVLEVISGFGVLPVKDLLQYTGASRESLNSLCRQKYIRIEKSEIYRRPVQRIYEKVSLPELNEEQLAVFNELSKKLFCGKYSVSLLNGITGSGKTMVYARLISLCIEKSCGAIFLLPEIALTPQMVSLFSSYFGESVALLHSGLSNGERYDEWKRIKNGQASVVIGTRSAVFAPVKNLELIIIDEEHEETYRSEASPRYNARDVARFRCHDTGCPLIIGSATPDLTSTYNALSGKYSLFYLRNRYNNSGLPIVSVVDMKSELRNGNGSDISGILKDEIAHNIQNGEQSIIFLNRRGTNRMITCTCCGHVYMCPNCSVALTYHGNGNRLICHCCGYSQKVERACPECGGILEFHGAGTQRIVEELNELFPDSDVLRMDADNVSLYGSHDALFEKFLTDKIPILVGTQMVGKGLNFENVTLVGVISADQSLYAGDYRASERTYSLITQVVGRSGRGDRPGRAVIQTFTPDNPVIKYAADQNYDEFYNYELEFRRLQHMPPFSYYYRICVSCSDETRALKCAEYVAACLRSVSGEYSDFYVFGPAPLSVAKMNNKYRFSVGLSSASEKNGRIVVSNTVIKCKKEKSFRDVSVFAEYNPL